MGEVWKGEVHSFYESCGCLRFAVSSRIDSVARVRHKRASADGSQRRLFSTFCSDAASLRFVVQVPGSVRMQAEEKADPSTSLRFGR